MKRPMKQSEREHRFIFFILLAVTISGLTFGALLANFFQDDISADVVTEIQQAKTITFSADTIRAFMLEGK